MKTAFHPPIGVNEQWQHQQQQQQQENINQHQQQQNINQFTSDGVSKYTQEKTFQMLTSHMLTLIADSKSTFQITMSYFLTQQMI